MKQFIREHREDDVRQLALQAGRYPDVDMPYALTQIAGWQSIREKVPSWAACEDIIYPLHLPLEQCSSEATAIYKYGIVTASGQTDSFIDLTGGFGIDCWFISRAFKQAVYVERQEALAKIAEHNFLVLFKENPLAYCQLSIVNSDSISWIKQQNNPIDWIFIDPARRDGYGGKTVAISDCEPDICALESLLVSKASHVMVKLSPMLDLSLAMSQLKHIQEAHIISVNNECKELLLILNANTETQAEATPIHCINIRKKDTETFCFTKQEEVTASCPMASGIGQYLYEPNTSVMKAGAFRSVAQRFGIAKLQTNSHLYTSDELIRNFPGRTFAIEAVSGFGKKELKALLADTPKANLTVRNFPATVADLRKRLHITEGGDSYLFVTTLHPQEKIIIKCTKI